MSPRLLVRSAPCALVLVGLSQLGPRAAAHQLPPLFPAQVAIDAAGALDIALGDLNGDGLADAVSGEIATKTVGVRFGLGDGHFAAPLSPSLNQQAVHVRL